MVDFLKSRKNFSKPGFGLRFVKIFPHGIVKFLLSFDNGLTEFQELLDAFLGGCLCYDPTVFTLQIKKIFQKIAHIQNINRYSSLLFIHYDYGIFNRIQGQTPGPG